MSKKRVSTIILVLAVAVLTAAGTWIAGSTIKSPAEVAARTAPPAPAPILVPVEERVLTSDIVTRDPARFGLPQPVSLVPSLVVTPEPATAVPANAATAAFQVLEATAAAFINGTPTP